MITQGTSSRVSRPVSRGRFHPALLIPIGIVIVLLADSGDSSAGTNSWGSASAGSSWNRSLEFPHQALENAFGAAAVPDSIPIGVRNRRTRAREMREGKISSGSDTTGRGPLSPLDTMKAAPRDSTARLKHFIHARQDYAYVDPLRRSTFGLYLPPPTSVASDDEYDTTTNRYRMRTTFAGKDVRVPVEYSASEYRELRRQQGIRKNWEAIAHAYQLETGKKKGLGDLFGKVTQIEIPVPKNPLFSIFGSNQIRLTISGQVDIHGAFRNVKQDLLTTNPLGQSRNEPDFSQEVQVAVKGEIGEKLKIDADWNTQRQFEYENQLHVRYTGYEDEIVQSVEAGNVSLATNSSFITSSQALFGIKAAFQLGPLRLTTLASQKKGQVKEMSVSGGAQSRPFTLRATDYSKDHYFLDKKYRNEYNDSYKNPTAVFKPELEIRDIEVWITNNNNVKDGTDRDIVAFIDEERVIKYQDDLDFRKNPPFQDDPGVLIKGSFIRLEPETDYTINRQSGVLSLIRSVAENQAIVVAYSIPDPTNSAKSKNIGNFGLQDTAKAIKLIMKLVKPNLKLSPDLTEAWPLQLKNHYPLGGRGLKKEGFQLSIKYEVYGKEAQDNILDNINLLQALGVDKYDEAGQVQPDNKFDYLSYTIDETRGELVFPTLEPFGDGIRSYLLDKGRTITEADTFAFKEVYNKTYEEAIKSAKNLYTITGTSTTSIASQYQLQAFGALVEGSVEVVVDGQKATPNVDYTVDYVMGTVTIRNQAYLVPGRNLQIRYEANDLFQLASKSLLGMRGDFDVGKTSTLGFTIMNLSQQTLSDKVRLGEEPISNTMYGIDGSTTIETPFITRMLNWLPGFRTTAPSQISLRGEIAYMNGDPNTRKSTIPQDAGSGIAYIDDFEGSRRTIPMTLNYGAWKLASNPVYVQGLDQRISDSVITAGDSRLMADTSKVGFKAKMMWYNVVNSVYMKSIWPNKSVRKGEEGVTPLELHFDPSKRSPYNCVLTLDEGLYKHPDMAWGGVMTSIGGSSTNLVDENINFIELWMRVDSATTDAKMHIDLGIVSEDVIPNKILNSEDGLLTGGTLRLGTLKDGEDLGLDMIDNAKEKQLFAAFIAKYPEFASDPAGDDFVAAPIQSRDVKQYEKFNGTEGNSKTEVGRFPDTEDLDRNNSCDQLNSYFEYVLPLNTGSDKFKQYAVGGGTNGWYQIRIPLTEFARRIGNPSFLTIQTLRIWMGEASSPVHVRIAEMNLVGNQWEELVRNDSTFRVSVVSYEENPGYEKPPGVTQARDQTQPDQEIYLNEQSLNLVLKNVGAGQSRQAIKRYNARPMDIFSYKTLKMFIHGDKTWREPRIAPGDTFRTASVFFRFGSDSLNYYEYRAPIYPGWVGNDITIHFSDLTALKQKRDSSTVIVSSAVPNGPAGSVYRLLGNPTLTVIRFLSIGVENPYRGGTNLPISGEVWVNEMRLTDVENTPGVAYRFETGIKLADVASVNFNITQQDPFFHSLENRFGTRTTSRNWAVSTSVAFERFLPQTWAGSSLGFSYSHSEGISDPRIMPGTDISVVSAAEARRQLVLEKGGTAAQAEAEANRIKTQSQTIVVSESYALPQVKLVIPSESWLVTETINRLSFGYTYNTQTRRDPNTQYYETWAWSFRGSYGLDFSPKNYVEPFSSIGDFFLFSPWKKTKLFYSPRNFSVGTTFNRGQTFEKSLSQTTAKPTLRNFSSTRNLAFGWQLSDEGLINPSIQYQVDVQSNLSHLELNPLGQQRGFGSILSDILNSNSLVNFGIDQQYGQSVDFSPKLVMPSLLDFDKIVTLTSRYSTRYDWTNNLTQGVAGRSARWSSSLSFGPDINLKTISDKIWPAASAAQTADTTKKGKTPGQILDMVSRILFKIPIFDFEKINLSFTQTNSSANSGVLGNTGFWNLFGRVPVFQASSVENGPSSLYQLGLSGDPHGTMTLKLRGKFPFFEGIISPGRRAPNLQLTDVFSQQNKLTMRTSRPLWEGARLELNWSYGTSYSSNSTIRTDTFGVPTVTTKLVSGDVERTFVTFPSGSIFKMFKTGMEDVNKKFEAMKADAGDKRTNDQKLSQAFEEGLEGLPVLQKVLGKMFPRANWSLRWDGLEKIPFFASVAERVSFDHSYSSTMRRRWKIATDGQEVTESQSVTYGFSPLLGLQFTFKKLSGGNLGAQLRYSTQTGYDLAPSTQNITQSNTSDISLTADFSKTGFELPLFGYTLSNDLTISFTYHISRTGRNVFDMKQEFKPDGTPLEGYKKTEMEPRIRYSLSAKVTMQAYYKYSKTEPDGGGSRVPGSTTNEAGFDIKVLISQ